MQKEMERQEEIGGGMHVKEILAEGNPFSPLICTM